MVDKFQENEPLENRKAPAAIQQRITVGDVHITYIAISCFFFGITSIFLGFSIEASTIFCISTIFS